MGITTYDELKKLQGNSVVVERQEKIEIEQTENNFTRRKHTLIREKFPRQESKKARAKIVSKKSKLEEEPLNETIARALLGSLIAEREQNKKIEEKLDNTAHYLNQLKEKIQHDIKDLKQEQSLIKMSLIKPEKYKNLAVKKHDKTWSEKLKDNETFKIKQEENKEVMVEKYSQKHQCVCISPRYTTNEAVAVRPKLRTIALQIGTPKCCSDRGAVGDHSSLNALNLKEEKVKDKDSLQNTKELLLKPMDPSLTKALPKDYIANCCYGATCCAAPAKPCHALCQRYALARECNGVICNQKIYQESGVTPQSEYNYCRDELYYVYPNSPQVNTTQTHSICGPQCRCMMNTETATNNRYGRHCSDLNTEHFYCRKTDRSASPKAQSSSKSKREANSVKNKDDESLKAKQAKEKKEQSKVKECRCEETCEEYALRKKRECEEKQKRRKERSKSRERSKSTDRREHSKSREHRKSTDKRERSRSKDPQEEKLRKLACEKILNESASKLVELFDSYADGKDTSIGTLFRYLADAKTQLSQESSSTVTSCNAISEEKTCPMPIRQKCTCPKHSRNFGRESPDSLDDNRSRKSQYSMEALQMLKKMKLREYKPAQPSSKEVEKSKKSKTKTKETTKEEDEKSKRYKEYINKYRQEDGEDNEESADKNSKKLRQSTEEQSQPFSNSKQQPQSSKYPGRPSKNPQNIGTDDEDVVERYEYGPAGGNGWDDYGKRKYDDDSQISQNQKRKEDKKPQHSSARNRPSMDDDAGRHSDNDGSKYQSPRPRPGDTFASNRDEQHYDKYNKSYRDEGDRVLDRGPKMEDERLTRTQGERRSNDPIPGSSRYGDEYNTDGIYRRGNRSQNQSPSRGSYETYEDRNQLKQSSKYQDETLGNDPKPGQAERGNRNPSPSRGSYETYEDRNQLKQSSKYQNEPLGYDQKPGQAERGNRNPSPSRGSYEKYEDRNQLKQSAKYQNEPLGYDQKPGQAERGIRNPSPSRVSYEKYEDRNQLKQSSRYQDETLGNDHKPGQAERGNRNPSPSRGSYETYEDRNQLKQSSKYQNEPLGNDQKPGQAERGNRNPSPSRGSYEQYEDRNQTKKSSKYQDEPSGNDHKPGQAERGNRNPPPSRGSYEKYDDRNQTKQSSKYQDEPSGNDHKPGQAERGNRNPSPSRGSYEKYEDHNQTKQSSRYQDEPLGNVPKPGQSEYQNYPIKQEEQRAGPGTQHSQRSSFDHKQRQDEMTVKKGQEENSRFNQKNLGDSPTKLYSSYDDFKQTTDHQSNGIRGNDPISKAELTDQESFQTYTKSAEIPNGEQRVEESRDKGLIEEGVSAPTSQCGYTKYKQNIRTKYIQEQDGTEITHTNEEITIDETYDQPTNIGPTNTEEAIRYLKSFLDSYEKYGFKEDCLKSVSTVTNDLINKLSACTTIRRSQSATSSPRLDNYNIVPEQPPLIDETKSTETQYRDLESTSYVSPIEIKQETQNYSPSIKTPTKNYIHSLGTGTKEIPSEQTTIKNVAEPQVLRGQESFSNNVSPKDNEDNYRYETVENYHYCEKQTQSHVWETEENYETLTNMTHLNPPEEFIDAQYPQQSLNCDEPNQYINTIYPPPPPMNTTNNNDEYYCLPECPESKYNNYTLPCSSRVSQKSGYNTSNSGTSSQSSCDRDLLPLKGILKPCRVKEAPTAASNVCDFESNKTISCVSFGNEEQIQSHKATTRMYTMGEATISQVNDENIDTLITKDESQRPLRKQSTITRCETTVKQPKIIEDSPQNDNQQSSACANINAQQPLHCQSAQDNPDATIPRFTQCPCMLDTYLKLLEIYCKEEDKFDFIKH